MLRKVIVWIVLVYSCFSFSECRTMKHLKPEAFKIKRAYYQSWVVSEDEKGTDIMLELKKVDRGVEFDSIVFRGVRLKAFATTHDNEVDLKSILTVGIPRIKIESQVIDLPDQLIYHYRGERKSFALTNIDRKDTRHY